MSKHLKPPSYTRPQTSKRSFLLWPMTISLAGTLVTAFHLIQDGNNGLSIGSVGMTLYDAFWIFAIILFVSLPVWLFITLRLTLSYQSTSSSKH